MNKKFIIWSSSFLIILSSATFIAIKEKKAFSKDNVKKINIINNNTSSNDESKIYNISSITEAMKGITLSIIGEITDIKEHKNGHIFLTVSDGDYSIAVPIFKNNNIDLNKIKLNNKYKFIGTVDIYKDKLEIIPKSNSDIIELKKEFIDKTHIGELIDIKCVVLSKYNHPNGHTFLTVRTENAQEIEIPIFKQLNFNSTSIEPGTELQIHGKIAEYKSKMQVNINDEKDIKVLKDTEPNKIKLVSLENINESNRGKSVQTKGNVESIETKNGHLYFNLNDGNHTIECVLFKADGDILEGKRVRIKHSNEAKFPIRVSGTINKYNDKIQLVVDKVFNEY